MLTPITSFLKPMVWTDMLDILVRNLLFTKRFLMLKLFSAWYGCSTTGLSRINRTQHFLLWSGTRLESVLTNIFWLILRWSRCYARIMLDKSKLLTLAEFEDSWKNIIFYDNKGKLSNMIKNHLKGVVLNLRKKPFWTQLLI